METSNSTLDRKPKVRNLMIISIRAYNNVLTEEHLNKMEIEELIANLHPQDRVRLETLWEEEQETLRNQLRKEGLPPKRTRHGES
jgi:hypothetical protein